MGATSKDADVAGAGEALRRESGKRRGFPAGGKIRLSSPLEWETERGDPRPPELRKSPGGIVREWEGELSRQGALTPLEWKSCPGGKRAPE